MRNRHLYPPDWFSVIRPTVLFKNKFRCQFCGGRQSAYGYFNKNKFIELLDAFEMAHAKKMGWKVKQIHLQVMHLDQDVTNNSEDNLGCGCNTCHMRYDNQFNVAKRLMKRK